MASFFHPRILCVLFLALRIAFPDSTSSQEVSAIRPAQLKCEYAANPMGVETPRPRLSWLLKAGDLDQRGLRQSAYQVLVASTEEKARLGEGDLWDSGRVESDETVHVEYHGRRLESRAIHWWRVRVWDQDGRVSGWSPVARWEMGLLKPEDWQAKWIQDAAEVASSHDGYHSELADRPERAKWVSLDLQQAMTFDVAKLYPANPLGAEPKRPGYLFPVRFRIEVADSADFANARTLVDQTEYDFSNPGGTAVEFSFASQTARYARLVVTRLADNGEGRFGFALAEVELLQRQREAPHASMPVSQGGVVAEASDSLEQRSWRLHNLTDRVKTARERNAGAPSPAPMIRTTFRVEKEPVRARAYVSALGLYELRLNGNRVGEHVLAPEWTDYTRRVQYQTLDVTNLLRQGENAVGAILGDGWYAGRIAFLPGRRWYGDKPKFILQLEIEFEDGTRKTIVSDERWKSTLDGPIRRSDLFDGEEYDARREMPGWDQPGFDDSSWRQVAVGDAGTAKLVSQYSEPMEVTTELKPVAVSEPSPGVYVLDLGQNMVGWLRMRYEAPAGTRVRLRHAEVLRPDGHVYLDNLRMNLQGAAAEDYYTFQGQGVETFEPRFTFHGFRYVEITGLPAKPPLDAFTGRVMHSAAPRTASIETSSPLLNQLMSNIWWTQTGNFTGIPTDCPQRGERAGWLADAQVFSQTAMFNMNLARFFTKWLQDIRDAQTADGKYPAYAPNPFLAANASSDRGFFGGNAPGWSDGAVVLPWKAWINYGDKRILEEHFDSTLRYIESIRQENPDLIWRSGRARGAEFGDWLNGDAVDLPDWPRAGAATPMDLFATAYFAYSTELVSRMAGVLGRGSEEKEYSELVQRIRSSFQREFVGPDGRLNALGIPAYPLVTGAGYPTDGDNQAGYTLALHFDLLPEDLRQAAMRRLLETVGEYNGHASTGIHTTNRMMLELAKRGRPNLAYQLLLNEKPPSWGYQIEQGATTVWERWDGYVPERGFQTPYMNSFNHYGLGAVGEWVYRYVLGIHPDPQNPGYRHFRLQPIPGGGLTFARGTYESIRGEIASSWTWVDDEFAWKVTVPVNTTATVYVPANSQSSVTENGQPLEQAEGIEFLRFEEGAAVVRVSSGQYEFGSKLARIPRVRAPAVQGSAQ